MEKREPKIDVEALILYMGAGHKGAVETAHLLGCSVATVYKYCNQPLVRARIAESKGREIEALAVKATAVADKSIGVLSEIATGEKFDSKSRVMASKASVEIAVKLRNEARVYPRLAALEAAVQEAGINLPTAAEMEQEPVGDEVPVDHPDTGPTQ